MYRLCGIPCIPIIKAIFHVYHEGWLFSCFFLKKTFKIFSYAVNQTPAKEAATPSKTELTTYRIADGYRFMVSN